MLVIPMITSTGTIHCYSLGSELIKDVKLNIVTNNVNFYEMYIYIATCFGLTAIVMGNTNIVGRF
jgi:hypothetical protein